jgi:two-component system LytT family response regulator
MEFKQNTLLNMNINEAIEIISININKATKEIEKVLIRSLCENKKIGISTNDGIWMVYLKDIIRMEAENNYTKFFFANGETLLIAKTLKEYEKLLCNYQFERIHKSHLVNLYHIKRYYKNEGGYVVMENEKQIMVSRYKRDQLAVRLQLL